MERGEGEAATGPRVTQLVTMSLVVLECPLVRGLKLGGLGY